MTDKTTIFEHTTCSRCGGSGNYSFNLMHGTRCYGCNGAGFKLTKRGAAAREWLIEQRSVRADQIAVGQRVHFDFYFWSGYKDVTEVEVQPNGSVRLSCERKGVRNSQHLSPDQLIPVAVSAERMSELKLAALEYQATLTKQGKVGKRIKP